VFPLKSHLPFICTVAGGELAIRELDKCAGIGWFKLDEMPADLTQITRENLAHYRQRLAQASVEDNS